MVAPYPFAALPRVSRAEAMVLRRLARGLDRGALENVAADLAPLLGGKLAIDAVALERWHAGAMGERADVPLVAVVFGDALAGPGVRLALELDPDLAGALIDRALGALDNEPRLGSGPVSEGERGVLTYLAARALARSGGRLRVVGLVTATASLRSALGDGALSAWPARLSVGPVIGWARLWIPDAWTAPPEKAPHPISAQHFELELSIVGGSATLRAAEISTLEAGDAIIPDTLTVSGAPLIGEVKLVAAHGGPSFHATLRRDGALVLGRVTRGDPTSASGRARVAADMSEPLTDAVADVPVEVRVELGRVILRVSELAALAPGEILTTGTPVGAQVTLRAAGEVVATGELCDVEGELGVRIIELARR